MSEYKKCHSLSSVDVTMDGLLHSALVQIYEDYEGNHPNPLSFEDFVYEYLNFKCQPVRWVMSDIRYKLERKEALEP